MYGLPFVPWESEKWLLGSNRLLTDFWTDFFDDKKPQPEEVKVPFPKALWRRKKWEKKNDVEVEAIGNTRVEGSEAIKTDGCF